MAGDWIKFELATSDKPEVWQIADSLGIDPDAVVGKLLRVWAWFDQHTEKGNAPSVTKKLLDRLVGITGFSEHMILSGWMIETNGNISLKNFDRHNGETAKKRALTAKRVAAHKSKSNADSNAMSVSDALPREEKNKTSTTTGGALDSFRMTPEFEPDMAALTAHLKMLGVPGGISDIDDALREFRSYWVAQDRWHTLSQWTQKFAKSVKRGYEIGKSGGRNETSGRADTGGRRTASAGFWSEIFKADA